MANWVTLPNGVHIDLDDPHNPVTGDGDWSDLSGGDKSSGGKGSKFDFSKATTYKAKNEHTIKVEGTFNGLVQYKERGASGVWQRFHTTPDKLKERLESRGYESAESTTISSKASDKGKSSASLVKNYGMPVAVNWNGTEYPIGDEPDNEDMASMRNEYGLEKLGTVKVEGKTYTIYGSGYGNLGHTKQVAVEEIDIDDSWTKPKTASKKDDGFTEWYNSLSKKDREDIDRHMGANKKPGAKYKR